MTFQGDSFLPISQPFYRPGTNILAIDSKRHSLILVPPPSLTLRAVNRCIRKGRSQDTTSTIYRGWGDVGCGTHQALRGGNTECNAYICLCSSPLLCNDNSEAVSTSVAPVRSDFFMSTILDVKEGEHLVLKRDRTDATFSGSARP